MADLITIKHVDFSTASDSGSAHFTSKDEDFGDPTVTKKIWALIFTYQATGAINMNTMFTYALDGGTSFVNTNVPATSLPSASSWNVARIELTSPVSCQSIRIKLSHGSVNWIIKDDIRIEYRLIKEKKVT